jgi:acyl dehydratase/NAD(P)-dependent dehydrogenase (short-subunit alcohol dehydrogenase family)
MLGQETQNGVERQARINQSAPKKAVVTRAKAHGFSLQTPSGRKHGETEVMDPLTLTSRRFTLVDQERFANVSGDRNPMHLDATFARRTRAAAPVVHGVHLLLWTLDAFAASHPRPPRLRSFRARFNRFVYLEDSAEAVLAHRGLDSARLNVCVAGVPTMLVAIHFGDPGPDSNNLLTSTELISPPATALDFVFEEMSDRSGRLAFATPPEVVAAMFPAAAEWLGPRRVAALAASSNLVGMVCPGRHSIFRGLSMEACAESCPQDVIAFRVTEADPRFRLAWQEIAGGGLTGSLECFAPTPPVSQPSMQSLAGLVNATEFAGAVALVVGGSRGLGELTSKLVATGGGRVVITYQVGRTDAERVAGEILEAGGTAEIMAYDARTPAEEQLVDLADAPTHLYYFATPVISQRHSDIFAPVRFDDFNAVYVHGFWHLAVALRARQPGLSIFYPSSTFVSERPRNMTEYAMAKLAGEALCADMNSCWAPSHVTVSRLPPLPTDQTASIIAPETASPVETLLQVVREVQSWPR